MKRRISLKTQFIAHLSLMLLGTLLMPNDAPAQFSSESVLDVEALSELSLEELTKVKVTSAAKREQRLSEVASAVFVISQRDIQRSTATTIPELLKMVPGLYVSQVNASTWSITSRGFGGIFANKLLVLIDGRTVFNPLFSGTYWEVQDYPLTDIERIEVIRGPGGTLWGTNAVNGVINIITKSAKDTHGGIVALQTGKEALGIGSVRYGVSSKDTDFSSYARGRLIDAQTREQGGPSGDEYNSAQTGFKFRQSLGEKTELGVQGDIYSQNRSERRLIISPLNLEVEEAGRMSHSSGGNILGHLTSNDLFDQDSASVRFYFDRANRDELVAGTSINILDLDTQYDYLGFADNVITVGGGIRHITDSTRVGRFPGLFTLTPDSKEYSIVNTFIQDEYSIIPKILSVTGGVKFEHNEFTGGTWQPSFKTLWNSSEHLSFWGSISRSVRIPARISNDVSVPVTFIPASQSVPLPTVVDAVGSHSTGTEIAWTYELGSRTQLAENVALDVAGFYADYSNLQTFDPGTAQLGMYGAFPVVRQPIVSRNNGEGTVWGIETVLEGKISQNSRIQFWHVYQHVDTTSLNGSTDPTFANERNNNPLNQVALRGQFDISEQFEFNPTIKFIEDVPSVHTAALWQVDSQIAWHPYSELRVTLNATNLLQNDHKESEPQFLAPPQSRIERAYFVGVTYQF